MSAAAGVARREEPHRRGVRLEAFTVAWNGLLVLRGQIDGALAAGGRYPATDEAAYDLWVMRAASRKGMGEPREPEGPDYCMFA